MNGWDLILKRKDDKYGDFYFTQYDKKEVIAFLKPLPKLVKAEINAYQQALIKNRTFKERMHLFYLRLKYKKEKKYWIISRK